MKNRENCSVDYYTEQIRTNFPIMKELRASNF
jgi:hypothetical protein